MRTADPSSAQAGGYALAVAGPLAAAGLLFHPFPAGGFEEQPSVLAGTPWWGPIHIAIAAGFVLVLLGSLLLLVAGGGLTSTWPAAFCWGAMTVGMIFFTGVAMVNGWVMPYLISHDAPETAPLLYDSFNQLLIGFGWLGNPPFLAGLTGIAILEVRNRTTTMPRPVAWIGLGSVILSWGRGVGSAAGLPFLEPLILANVPAFLWLGYFGMRVAAGARVQIGV